jgi:hypothetical protein
MTVYSRLHGQPFPVSSEKIFSDSACFVNKSRVMSRMAQELRLNILQRPNHRGGGGGKMKKWLHNIKSRIASLTSDRTEAAAWQETAAMVYDGDIYAVLLRDRAARRLTPSTDHRPDYRRDASWPFIR